MQNYRLEQERYYNYPNNKAATVPYTRKVQHKKPQIRKKKQPSRAAVMASVCFWSIIMAGACLVNSSNFLEPVYFNRIQNKALHFNASETISPTLKYMTNLNIMGTNLLSGVPSKGKEKIIPIKSSGELTVLKKEIKNILAGYNNLHAGIFIYDYSTGYTVEINDKEVFPAASIIKIPVLLDLFNRNKDLEKEGFSPINLDKKITFTEAHRTEGSGDLQYKSANVDYSVDYLAKIMIRSSDNSATNMLVEEVGGINELNTSLRHWGFSKTQMTSWLPDLKGTNTTTPYDISTMLYNIDNQKFIPMNSSASIKEYMSKVENQTLIRSQVPDDVILMHKTGDIGGMLGDAGIVFTPSGKKFILTIMVKRPHNDYSARELIQKVSKAAYNSLG